MLSSLLLKQCPQEPKKNISVPAPNLLQTVTCLTKQDTSPRSPRLDRSPCCSSGCHQDSCRLDSTVRTCPARRSFSSRKISLCRQQLCCLLYQVVVWNCKDLSRLGDCDPCTPNVALVEESAVPVLPTCLRGMKLSSPSLG